MYFLFSGEGATDLGICRRNIQVCHRDAYDYGPMTVMVDHIAEACLNFSPIDLGCYGFVSKRHLVDRADEIKAAKKRPRLPGKKTQRETAYFYRNARVLAICAKEKETELNDQVIAILFRDSDGTASAGRGLWMRWTPIVGQFLGTNKV